MTKQECHNAVYSCGIGNKHEPELFLIFRNASLMTCQGAFVVAFNTEFDMLLIFVVQFSLGRDSTIDLFSYVDVSL